MDPEIDSVTWIKLGNNMAPLTLVVKEPGPFMVPVKL